MYSRNKWIKDEFSLNCFIFENILDIFRRRKMNNIGDEREMPSEVYTLRSSKTEEAKVRAASGHLVHPLLQNYAQNIRASLNKGRPRLQMVFMIIYLLSFP